MFAIFQRGRRTPCHFRSRIAPRRGYVGLESFKGDTSARACARTGELKAARTGHPTTLPPLSQRWPQNLHAILWMSELSFLERCHFSSLFLLVLLSVRLSDPPCLSVRIVASFHVEQSLSRLGAEVVGIDPSPENVAVASAHAQGDPMTRAIRYEAVTAEELEARGTHMFSSLSLALLLSEMFS